MGKEDMNNSEHEVFSCVGILDPVIAHCFLFKELVLSTQLVSDFFFFRALVRGYPRFRVFA